MKTVIHCGRRKGRYPILDWMGGGCPSLFVHSLNFHRETNYVCMYGSVGETAHAVRSAADFLAGGPAAFWFETLQKERAQITKRYTTTTLHGYTNQRHTLRGVAVRDGVGRNEGC